MTAEELHSRMLEEQHPWVRTLCPNGIVMALVLELRDTSFVTDTHLVWFENRAMMSKPIGKHTEVCKVTLAKIAQHLRTAEQLELEVSIAAPGGTRH